MHTDQQNSSVQTSKFCHSPGKPVDPREIPPGEGWPAEYPSPPAAAPPKSEIHQFETGAVRSKDADSVRYDLISPIALRRMAETYHEGSQKYGDDNWLRGFPYGACLNHAMRHIELWRSGDRSEDHLAHAAWNLFAIMHYEETQPHLENLPYKRERERLEAELNPFASEGEVAEAGFAGAVESGSGFRTRESFTPQAWAESENPPQCGKDCACSLRGLKEATKETVGAAVAAADADPMTAAWAEYGRRMLEDLDAKVGGRQEPCCERDHDRDGNCDRHKPVTAVLNFDPASQKGSYAFSGVMIPDSRMESIREAAWNIRAAAARYNSGQDRNNSDPTFQDQNVQGIAMFAEILCRELGMK